MTGSLKFGILFILILVSAHCRTHKPNRSEMPVIIADWERQGDKIFDLEKLIRDLKLTPLDNAEDVNIANVTKLVVSHDGFYLGDQTGNAQETLWIFDTEGKFDKAIHTPGKGPGEYLEIHDFFINETTGQIYIVDARGDKMLIYSKDAILLEEISLPLEQGKYLSLDNDRIIKLRGRFISINEKAPYHELEIIDFKNNKNPHWFAFKNNWEGWKPDENELCNYKDGVIMHHPYDFNVYYLNSNLELTPLMRFDYGSKAIDTSGFFESNSFVDFHIQCNQRQGKYEYKIGQILPMGDDFFVSKGIGDQQGFMIISAKDYSCCQYKSGISRISWILQGMACSCSNFIQRSIPFWDCAPM